MKIFSFILIVIALLLSSCSGFFPARGSGKLSIDDVAFCYERELWDILSEYEKQVESLSLANPQNELLYDVLESLALNSQDTLKFIYRGDRRITNTKKLSDTFRMLRILKSYSEDLLTEKTDKYLQIFTNSAASSMIKWQAGLITEDEMEEVITSLDTYPQEFENYIKRLVDEVAVERNDSLRIVNCQRFTEKYPASEWQDLNQYMMTVSLLNLGNYQAVLERIRNNDLPSASLSHLYAGMLQNPLLRKNYLNGQQNIELLNLSLEISTQSVYPQGRETIRVIYNYWDEQYWQNKTALLEAKAIYFKIIAESANLWGDEEIIALISLDSQGLFNEGWKKLQSIHYKDNDYGEIAELNYWKGRFAALLYEKIESAEAAEHFIDCLVAGSPRKRFDDSAMKYLNYLHSVRNIEEDVMSWSRSIKNYQGPVFLDVTENAGLAGNRSSRVAVADFNNDGYADILLNGRHLFRNNGDFTFTDVSNEAGIKNFGFVGGLWADYNKDGHLDLASFSRNLEGDGNKLFRNNGDGTFSIDETSAINDYSPTEGAAWIDVENNGYPSLYLANYERWQVRTGFEDFFWHNNQGLLTDKSLELGFRTPPYTTNPGLAGRGVSPGDYNNDGRQSIFVSNYRLHRNFLWDYKDGLFYDSAALNGVRGHLQRGYYGHTIGADWGDYNNNGRLDLFLCNLAHPRFLEFSDISMLLRNDGAKQRKIGKRVVNYHSFTDVTQEAGIKFDELHSDPNWFDTNNNGFLDLYMTSIYENDRSYLYLSNRDGTFTDITFLSGTRVYNGWGNAVADFNHNGRLDLIVAGGSGVRLFKNVTDNKYVSYSYKPYWDTDKVKMVERAEWNSEIPNSPAFGTRVETKIALPDGSIRKLIRELNGGKGTTSQNDQYLHIGLGEGKLIEAVIR